MIIPRDHCLVCGHHKSNHILSGARCDTEVRDYGEMDCQCPGLRLYDVPDLTEDQKNQLRGHGLLDDGIEYVPISDPATERIVARVIATEKEAAQSGREKNERCEKCSSNDIHVRWHGAASYHPSRKWQSCWGDYGDNHGEPKEEHLHYHCRTCQFDWTGPLTPPEGNQ